MSSDKTIRWLHLSDLHFGPSERWDQRVILTSLLRDLGYRFEHEGLRPDLVFLTGDLTNRGKHDEFRQTGAFLRKVAELAGLDLRERIFVVPGNHDVNREQISCVDASILNNLLDEDQIANVLGNGRIMEFLAPRLNAFYEFTKTAFDGARSWTPERPWRSDRLTIREIDIGVAQLNTAWASGPDDATQRLLLGEFMVREAVGAISACHLRFALLHHPIEELREFDADRAHRVLKGIDGVHLILRGHLHRNTVNIVTDPDGESVTVAAGACYTHDRWSKSYVIGEVNVESGEGALHLFRFSPDSDGHWVRDTHSYRNCDGTFPFSLRALSPPPPAPDVLPSLLKSWRRRREHRSHGWIVQSVAEEKFLSTVFRGQSKARRQYGENSDPTDLLTSADYVIAAAARHRTPESSTVLMLSAQVGSESYAVWSYTVSNETRVVWPDCYGPPGPSLKLAISAMLGNEWRIETVGHDLVLRALEEAWTTVVSDPKTTEGREGCSGACEPFDASYASRLNATTSDCAPSPRNLFMVLDAWLARGGRYANVSIPYGLGLLTVASEWQSHRLRKSLFPVPVWIDCLQSFDDTSDLSEILYRACSSLGDGSWESSRGLLPFLMRHGRIVLFVLNPDGDWELVRSIISALEGLDALCPRVVTVSYRPWRTYQGSVTAWSRDMPYSRIEVEPPDEKRARALLVTPESEASLEVGSSLLDLLRRPYYGERYRTLQPTSGSTVEFLESILQVWVQSHPDPDVLVHLLEEVAWKVLISESGEVDPLDLHVPGLSVPDINTLLSSCPFFLRYGRRIFPAHALLLNFMVARRYANSIDHRELPSHLPDFSVAQLVYEILRLRHSHLARAVGGILAAELLSENPLIRRVALRILATIDRNEGDGYEWIPKEADLRALDLRGEDLRRVRMRRVYLDGCDLSGACLEGTVLDGSSLVGSFLCGAKLNGASLIGVCASEAAFSGANGYDCNFTEADLRGCTLRSSTWINCTWSGAKLDTLQHPTFLVLGPERGFDMPPEARVVPRYRMQAPCARPSLAWSPDNKWVASSSGRGESALWEPRSGSAIASFSGLSFEASTIEGHVLAWSADGAYVTAEGPNPGMVTVWDISTLDATALPNDIRGTFALSWHPKKNVLAHLGFDEHGYRVSFFFGEDLPVARPAFWNRPMSISWSENGEHLVVLSEAALHVVDVSVGCSLLDEEARLGENETVLAAYAESDGALICLVAGPWEKRRIEERKYYLSGGKAIRRRVLLGGEAEMRRNFRDEALSFIPCWDGTRWAFYSRATGRFSTPYLVNRSMACALSPTSGVPAILTRGGEVLRDPVQNLDCSPRRWELQIVWSPDGLKFAVVEDGRSRLRVFYPGEITREPEFSEAQFIYWHRRSASALVLERGGRGVGSRLRLASGDLTHELEEKDANFAWHPYEEQFTYTRGPHLRYWRPDTGEEGIIDELSSGKNDQVVVAWSSLGDFAVHIQSSHVVEVRCIGGESPIIELPGRGLSWMQWSADGRYLAVMGERLDVLDRHARFQSVWSSGRTFGLGQWSPTENLLACPYGHLVMIIDPVHGAEPGVASYRHRLLVGGVAWDHDGRRFASISDDGVVAFYSRDGALYGQLLLTADEHCYVGGHRVYMSSDETDDFVLAIPHSTEKAFHYAPLGALGRLWRDPQRVQAALNGLVLESSEPPRDPTAPPSVGDHGRR